MDGAVKKLERGAAGMPLRAAVINGRFIISIGIDTMAFAFHHGENNNPFNDQLNDFSRTCTIADPLEFAKDVCAEVNREWEDGSTPLTRFLDSMMESAVEQGSMGILDPDGDE